MKDGASFTASIVIVNDCVLLVSVPPPSSMRTTSTLVLPSALAAGVNVRVPEAEMSGPAANSDGSSGVAVNVSVCELSFAGPLLMPVAQPTTVFAPESSSTVTSAPLVKVGGSLISGMEMWNVCGLLESSPPFKRPPSSTMRNPTVAVPLALAAGV